MRMPVRPPDPHSLWKRVNTSTDNIFRILDGAKGHLSNDEYLHYDDLMHREPPPGLSHEEWWFSLKWRRRPNLKDLPLEDEVGLKFHYCLPDPISERMHEIDLSLGGQIESPDLSTTNRREKDRYIINSLIEEGITSSQLEGAATTRQDAKEMIRQHRPPQDRSERMILNNFLTMREIQRFKENPLSKEMVLEIHRLITENTFDDPEGVGRFRRLDESVRVVDPVYAKVFHDPPPAEQLEDRMAAMCEFANGKTPDHFIHPAIRAIILHFWLAYDHPFVDGNGRTARALFYWAMLNYGYWLFECISISQIILKGPAKYGRAFLFTETDENDLTYFIRYHLDVIARAMKELQLTIKRKSEQNRALAARLGSLTLLNHRQRALISHASRHPHQIYTVRSHQTSHKIANQTARNDLQELNKRGLLDAGKQGRTWCFTPAKNLEEKLAAL